MTGALPIESNALVAYLGNSITAQKNSFRSILQELLATEYGVQEKEINAGIGGVGSLACAFLMDDFVLERKPSVCFLDCCAADRGGVTPEKYIDRSVEGMVWNLINRDITVFLLNLYRSDTNDIFSNRIVSIYKRIASKYNLQFIDIDIEFRERILKGEITEEDVVYDGIHTHEKGAKWTAEFIFNELNSDQNSLKKKQEEYSQNAFVYTQLILPNKNWFSGANSFIWGRFRLALKYAQLNINQTVLLPKQEGILVGLFVIADESSGVVAIEKGQEIEYIQVYDQWCDKERIQLIVLDEIDLEKESVSLFLTNKAIGSRGANGKLVKESKVGENFKVIAGLVQHKHNHYPKFKLLLR